MKFISEFKKFALKGNVMDMAIGVIIGGAFGKIVSSLVNDMIMPLIGVLIGGIDFTKLKWVISPSVIENGNEVKAEVSVLYGNFLQNTVDFLIIAFTIFIFITMLNKIQEKFKKQEEVKEEEKKTELTQAEILLQIRDILKGEVDDKEEKTDDKDIPAV